MLVEEKHCKICFNWRLLPNDNSTCLCRFNKRSYLTIVPGTEVEAFKYLRIFKEQDDHSSM